MFYYRAQTLDDLLHGVLTDLLDLPFDIGASRGDGAISEMYGVLLKLDNPRARLSRTEARGKSFSALGEFLWYMSKSNSLDFIQYYIPKYSDYTDDGQTIHGGYGPRLFRMHNQFDQVTKVIDLLKEGPTTKRAVIQVVDASDLAKHYKDIPCTCTLHFVIRDNKLHMHTSMRSNDAFLGLPHDIYCFTMIQELIACSVGVDMGTYNHSVASLHLYRSHAGQAQQYLKEGYQSTKFEMPKMPLVDPWAAIKQLMVLEGAIRSNGSYEKYQTLKEPYWIDLGNLLLIHKYFLEDRIKDVEQIQSKLQHSIYKSYIQDRLDKHAKK